jgi:outer membrane receptor for Fe3+-dicitrate
MAIGSTMMPGSNPLFGLNTLGGALALQTKDGRTAHGTTVEATFGSSVRRAVEFEHGGSRASGLHWYLAGNFFAEDGWRDASPSRVDQLFGKLGWHATASDIAISVGYADNALTGNPAEQRSWTGLRASTIRTRRTIGRVPQSHPRGD